MHSSWDQTAKIMGLGFLIAVLLVIAKHQAHDCRSALDPIRCVYEALTPE